VTAAILGGFRADGKASVPSGHNVRAERPARTLRRKRPQGEPRHPSQSVCAFGVRDRTDAVAYTGHPPQQLLFRYKPTLTPGLERDRATGNIGGAEAASSYKEAIT